MPMKCALATVAIGESHQSTYAAIFKPSVERYVVRNGYDLLVFDDYVGGENYRDPSFMSFVKLLIPYQETMQSYDWLMVLDVDILISARTPPFHELDLGTKIGVVDEWCQPSREERLRFQAINGLEHTALEYYRLAGFPLESECLINGGMFICAPRAHGPFFRDIVARHTETLRGHPRGDQAMFGYELQTKNLAHLLPTAWNCLWPHHRRTAKWGMPSQTGNTFERWADLRRFREVFDANYLLHMTGGLDHDLAFVCRNR
jgi:hypothetical protein